jgi:hypothetical protein
VKVSCVVEGSGALLYTNARPSMPLTNVIPFRYRSYLSLTLSSFSQPDRRHRSRAPEGQQGHVQEEDCQALQVQAFPQVCPLPSQILKASLACL